LPAFADYEDVCSEQALLTYWDLPLDGCHDFEPEKFPAMIAAALRQIMAEKSL
jgi:hypothetical protein